GVKHWSVLLPMHYSGNNDSTAVMASEPSAPSVVFASNGRVIQRTTNRGCSWKTVLDLDAVTDGPLINSVDSADDNYEAITGIYVGNGASAADRRYLYAVLNSGSVATTDPDFNSGDNEHGDRHPMLLATSG